MVPVDYGVAIDVLWFHLPRTKVDPPDTLAYLDAESMIITIPRAAPFLAEVVDSVTSWDQVKLLTVQINRLDRWWKEGLLCIGDSAHAMSPAFGVGINYAIQDAVATANMLVDGLRAGTVSTDDLARIQKRRLAPVVRMQALQLRTHTVIAKPGGGVFLPHPMKWWQRGIAAVVLPVIRLFTARIVGRGFRPEVIEPQLEPR